MRKDRLWEFTDNYGTFYSASAQGLRALYFPLANEHLMSCLSPFLAGDSKSGQDSFLLTPVSRVNLSDSRESRNFWVYFSEGKLWSASGVSKYTADIQADKFTLEAGLLWHSVSRENKRLGLKSAITSFIPQGPDAVEVMQVELQNISGRKLKIIPTAAIPIYARGANSIRDHRHVTSLLNRVILDKHGVIVRPTLSFNEAGHKPNRDLYFVLGWDEKRKAPQALFPTRESFCGEAGDLEEPLSVTKNLPVDKNAPVQGREAMGALRFAPLTLKPGESRKYIIVMGIADSRAQVNKIKQRFSNPAQVRKALDESKAFWRAQTAETAIESADSDFNNWFQWVSIQPVLRRIFGCSFLPDFDYGKGGRGWRDLWQDCLGLLLIEPQKVRSLLLNNFSGVRIDGSNATIIGKKPGEFISDRNNLSRVWMDHGAWPLLTLDLYLNETGDFKVLLEKTAYFKNHEVSRARERDSSWSPSNGLRLKGKGGQVYKGTVLEHLLVQNLVQFFNVGRHNQVRLEGADWNDGLDMAFENGESVAFSAMYASNILRLAELLAKIKADKIQVAAELKTLFSEFNYNDRRQKLSILKTYFKETRSRVSGKTVAIDRLKLINNLKAKSEWMMNHIRNKEWLKQGLFNGYYDNLCRPVDGKREGLLNMTLTSQVFPIMSGVATEKQVVSILKNARSRLKDKKHGGYHLNTDFKKEQHHLGRAFSFAYGEKENGAFFNHMAIMFAYALYKRGFIKEGWEVLNSIYSMALDTGKSRIYPCLPEYFNNEGRGMYSYLTGSASWFVLTMLTEVFGIKGSGGDLCIEPKLTPDLFGNSRFVSLIRTFAGRRLKIVFLKSAKHPYPGSRVIRVKLNSILLNLPAAKSVIIKRPLLLKLAQNPLNTLEIQLG
jgi:cellobiose phosphorylase